MMGSVVWAQEAVFIHIYLLMLMLGQVCSWVELPVQRRFCLIFVREVGSPDLHECFRGLTGSQRTPRNWGVTPSLDTRCRVGGVSVSGIKPRFRRFWKSLGLGDSR